MTWKKFSLLILLAFQLGCHQASESTYEFSQPEAETDAAMTSTDDADQTSDPDILERYLIKNGDVEFRVADLPDATQRARNLTEKFGGYVTETNHQRYGRRAQTDLTLRVPAERFDSLMTRLVTLATYLDHQNVSATDVTEEFVDLEARLRTKRDVRARYVDILRNQASTVEEVLQAEELIRTLTEEIEAKEGRLRFLRDRVAVSTIRLTMYEIGPEQLAPDDRPGFGAALTEAFRDSLTVVRDLSLWLVRMWFPIVLIALALWWWRRRRSRN